MPNTTHGTEPESYDAAAAGLRVAQLRQYRGWSARELARRADLSPTYVSNFERGNEPHALPKTLRQFADALGWPDFAALLASDAMEPPAPLGLYEVVTQSGPPGGTQLVDRTASRALNRGRGPRPAGAVELPWGLFVTTRILGRANLGDGEGYVSEPVTVPVDVVRGRNFGAWECAGSCMEPELSGGDIVLVDLDQRPSDGEIVIARRRSGEVLLKRYYRRAPAENGEPAQIELRPNIEAAGVGEVVIAAEGEVDVVGVVFFKMRAVGRPRLGQLSWVLPEPDAE